MKGAQSKSIRLLVIDDEEIYGHIYQYLTSRYPVELLAVHHSVKPGLIAGSIASLEPDVLVRGTTSLGNGATEELARIRLDCPRIGIVLLLTQYTSKDIEVLRNLAANGSGGMAVYHRQSLHRLDQLVEIITAVSHGQIILDAAVASQMLAIKPECPYLKQLTSRELEILDLLAKGYTNSSIAKALFIDVKTVEHHLNNVYSKLKADASFASKHPRVAATILYLHEGGQLAL